jgi:hypothetical protein
LNKEAPDPPVGVKRGQADGPPLEKAKGPPKDGGQPQGGHAAALVLRHVVLDEVNVEGRTISATVVGGPGRAKLLGLPLVKDAKIVVEVGDEKGPGDRRAPLAALRPGMRVALQLVVVQDQLAVAEILAERKGGLNEERGPDPKKAALVAAYKAARADLAVARANVDVARARLKAAEVALSVSQGERERKQAEAALEVARAELAKAEAVVAATEARVKALDEELGRLQEKEPSPPSDGSIGP